LVKEKRPFFQPVFQQKIKPFSIRKKANWFIKFYVKNYASPTEESKRYFFRTKNLKKIYYPKNQWKKRKK